MSNPARSRPGAYAIPVPSDPDPATRERIEKAFARAFAGNDGGLVLGYLRALTIERVLGSQSSDAALRQIEGQRQLVHTIESLIERGVKGAGPVIVNAEVG